MKQKKKKKTRRMLLLGTLAASSLGSALAGKVVIKAGEGTIKAGQEFLMPPHALTNFEIQVR